MLLQSAATFWDRHGSSIESLLVWAGAILVYALIVNYFYQILSKRVMFGGKKATNGTTVVGGPLRGFAFVFMFPLVSFAFFLVISSSLIFLSGGDQDVTLALTLAMAIVLAVRVAAYFSESTSHDVAKMLPLGLLGVFLVNADVARQDIVESIRNTLGIFHHLDLVVLYFGIVVIVEFLCRSLYMLVRGSRSATRRPAARS